MTSDAAAAWVSSTRAFQYDFDAAVLRAALRRVVGGHRMRVAESLCRENIRVDTLPAEIGDDVVGPPGRQVDVVLDAGLLQCGAEGQIVGIAEDNHFCFLQILQARDVLAARLRAARAELIPT